MRKMRRWDVLFISRGRKRAEFFSCRVAMKVKVEATRAFWSSRATQVQDSALVLFSRRVIDKGPEES